MKIKKLSENIITPTKAYEHDAGIDVYSPTDAVVQVQRQLQIKLGLSIELEKDEVAIMSERSGMAIKYGITSIGNVIDSGYRGEISIILFNATQERFLIKKGDKIGQILVMKLGNNNIEIVDYLSETERGENAHYSSGVN